MSHWASDLYKKFDGLGYRWDGEDYGVPMYVEYAVFRDIDYGLLGDNTLVIRVKLKGISHSSSNLSLITDSLYKERKLSSSLEPVLSHCFYVEIGGIRSTAYTETEYYIPVEYRGDNEELFDFPDEIILSMLVGADQEPIGGM